MHYSWLGRQCVTHACMHVWFTKVLALSQPLSNRIIQVRFKIWNNYGPLLHILQLLHYSNLMWFCRRGAGIGPGLLCTIIHPPTKVLSLHQALLEAWGLLSRSNSRRSISKLWRYGSWLDRCTVAVIWNEDTSSGSWCSGAHHNLQHWRVHMNRYCGSV